LSTEAFIRKRTPVIAFVAIVAMLSLSVAPAIYALQNRTQRDIEKEMQDRQYKELNKKRQQEIHDDTERLFQLATELKAAVEKTNENVLSLDVVRKADEVEKLAKKVKEKMKESIAPPPKVEPVPPPRMSLGRPPR
jgi:HAMP domain-containing protein